VRISQSDNIQVTTDYLSPRLDRIFSDRIGDLHVDLDLPHKDISPMGLNNIILASLLDLKQRGKLDGASNVIEVGAQQLSNAFLQDSAGLDAIYQIFGKERPSFGNSIKEGYISGLEHLSESNPSSRIFWKSLGFSYSSIEFDGHRDSIAVDLNRDSVPKRMRGVFDLLINAGTTEHVANQDNAFKVMHDLVKKGGIMMHELPAGGMMNHGLVNYNMKFFWHLCRENNYEVLALKMSSWGANPVPQNIIDNNKAFHGDGNFIDAPEVHDFMITAALRKTSEDPFVTVMDLPAELALTMKSKSRSPWAAIMSRFLGTTTSR
jgi:hypothetical protein